MEDAGWEDSDNDGIRDKVDFKCTFDVYSPGVDQDRYYLAGALAENA